jgi:transcriptional regulator with XRE-family HTH domain
MYSSLKDAVRSARKSQGLTQRDVAAKSGVNHATISRVESGKTTTHQENLGRILEVLNITTWYEINNEKIQTVD